MNSDSSRASSSTPPAAPSSSLGSTGAMNVRQVVLDHLGRVDALKREGKIGGKGKTAAQNRHISRAAAELDGRLHLVDFEVVSQFVGQIEKDEQAVDTAKELTTVTAEIERLETFKGRIAQKKKPELTRLSSRHASLLAAQLYFDALKFEQGTAPNAKINTVLTRTQGHNMDFESWADSKTSSSLLAWMPEERQFGVPEDEPSWGNSHHGMVESAAATKFQAIADTQKATAMEGRRKRSTVPKTLVDKKKGKETKTNGLDQLLSIDEDKALHEHFGNGEPFDTGAFMVTGPDGVKAADGGEFRVSMNNFPGWLEAEVSRGDKAAEVARIAEAKERSELKALKNTWSTLPLILPEVWLPVHSNIKESDADAVVQNVTRHFDLSSPSPDVPHPSRFARANRRGHLEDRELSTAFLPPGPVEDSPHPRPFGNQPEHLTPAITSDERGRPLSPPLPSISASAPSNTGSNAQGATAPSVSPVAVSLINSVVHGIEMITAATTLVSLRDQASGPVAQEQDLAERIRALPRRVGTTDFAHDIGATMAVNTLTIESESPQEYSGEETQDMDWEA
ncbi:hypothetical protein KC340_g352 [Hortaea werneckii]|nr:hypothetical protein KC339_g13401 [Hortaea werneckii]KAI7245578.1 hypothetical protein KC365_g336 [Hortaea werneckii]KAI7340246.1 hypothetical protein KC340_g352 [Hortaea werneckii]KAI7391362.1 hypothetical protein KC328_g7523 [Hortaea werneckii]